MTGISKARARPTRGLRHESNGARMLSAGYRFVLVSALVAIVALPSVPAAAGPASDYRGQASADHRLLESANVGDVAGVRDAMAAGASVDSKDSNGMTPLLWAAYRGHIGIVKHLLKNGADVEQLDSRGSHLEFRLLFA